ncbi:phospholipase D-like domain-containing protein [Flavobacterium procerum]|uniref:phospholipase D n=1 Tax=Flavobacterium procerum TaxID=1455569 RepID=A0ABV6BVP2_9FLAO
MADDYKSELVDAVQNAKKEFLDLPGVIKIEQGFRFKNGWITDEEVISVEVAEKMNEKTLMELAVTSLPKKFMGYGIDVVPAGFEEQLKYLGVDTSFWAAPKPGAYREPQSLELPRVVEYMEAIFHVSPDSGWPNLKNFLGRVTNKLTATMYEWEAEHISKAIFEAVQNCNGSLKMVTQNDGTDKAVDNMKSRLGSKFEHVWSSVGKGKLIASDYHIKVATRDDEEFWLSSGNWKNSNQADIDPAGKDQTIPEPLAKHNREWNVVIKNSTLATIFRKYIDWDFEEAQRVPFDVKEKLANTYVYIPKGLCPPVPPVVRYFDPLPVNRVLDVQPLLTPDRDSDNQRMFLHHATEMIRSANNSIDIENQSFSLLETNDPVYESFYRAIVEKQDSGVAVRIIFRDPREFGPKGQAGLVKTLTRLKKFGFNTGNIKVQCRCHTKAIIVDSLDDVNAKVLFGSHNFTTTGAMYNRDASLLIRDSEVARYFQEIFDFDWSVLAVQETHESITTLKLALASEAAPEGFQKVLLSEILGEA